MADLGEQLKRDLAALRERSSPSAETEARVLAAVEAVGFGPEFEPDGEPERDPGPDGAASHTPASAQLVWVAKIVAATLALTGAGLLTVATVARTLRAPTPAPEPPSEVTPSPMPAPAPELEPAPTPEAIDTPPTASVTAPNKPSRPTPTASSPDTLAAELALIEAARTAGDARTALEHLREHERSFEHGALATEREVSMIERLCELGSFEQARARMTRSFSAGDSPQRSKLLAACPELARE